MSSRRGSFRSFFGGNSKDKAENKKVRLGKDFFADWEELDKQEIQEHEQIKQLEEFVRKGLVTQEVYEKLVRESKEKRLGLYKKREVKEKWEEKPIIQGYLYHRVQTSKNRYKWKKFHFTLYRARLVWRKKRASDKVLGSLLMNKNFCLEELETISRENLPIAQQGSRDTARTNKHAMRFSFKLTCFGDSWEFSAESEALKRYWFHTLGLQISRIIERAQLTDKPLLMTTRPKLQTMPDNVAQSVRDYNLKLSTKNMSVRSLQRDRFQSNVSKNKSNTYFPAKDIDHDTSVSKAEEKTNTTKIRKIMYLPKEAVLKNPSLIEETDDNRSRDSRGIPILEVGEAVTLAPNGKYKSKRQRKKLVQDHDESEQEVMPVDSNEEELETKTEKKRSVSERIQNKLGLRARSPSFEDKLQVSLKDLNKQLSLQSKKVKNLTGAFEIVSYQQQMMKEDLLAAKENPDDTEGIEKAEAEYKRAKEMALSQEELLAAASFKKQKIKEMINKKEKELAKTQVTRELVVEAAKKRKSNVQNVAKGLFLETVRKEEEIANKTSRAREAAKLSRQREINCQKNLERALELKEHSMQSDGQELLEKAQLLLEQAKEELRLAQEDRKEKEAAWAEAVEEGLNMRMKAIEIKKALKPRRVGNKSFEKSKRKLKPVKSTHALANYMAQNVDTLSPADMKPKKPVSKLQNFLSSAAEDEAEANASPVNDNYDDDYSESFYSDEGYANVKESDLENHNFTEIQDTENYFEETTKHIPESAKDILSKRFIAQEIDRLCTVIAEIGESDEEGTKFVTYGRLREEYENISDGLNGILVKAKAEGRIDYDGSFLLQDDKDVKITLLEI